MRIRELPLHAQPAQRIAADGPAALSDAELLALVSGQQDLDVCQAALTSYQGWVGLLRADDRALAASIGTARKAAAVRAALEIGRRLVHEREGTRFQVRSPADVATLLMVDMLALDQEDILVTR
jgi:DNA repair protein RadC